MRRQFYLLLALALAGCGSENGTGDAEAATTEPVAPASLPSTTDQAKEQGLPSPECQMDQCSWVSETSREVVRRNEHGELVKVVYNLGTSDHIKGAYDSDAAISWEPAVTTTYSFCSQSLPAQMYQSEKGWKPVIFDFPDFIFGFQKGAANTYLSVCHNIAGTWDEKEIAKRFGYSSPPKGTEELTFKSPIDIFDFVSKMGKFSFSALQDDDVSPGAGCSGNSVNREAIVAVEWGGSLKMRPNGILTEFYAPGTTVWGRLSLRRAMGGRCGL